MFADAQSLLRLEVPLIVRIATRLMPVEAVLALGPGALIELPKRADEDLEIVVNNKTIGLGRALKVGEHFGVQVTFVGDVASRLEALAGRRAVPAPAPAVPPGSPAAPAQAVPASPSVAEAPPAPGPSAASDSTPAATAAPA